MFYLLLAIASSAMVSIIMRLSSSKVKGNLAMLAMNYLMCLSMAAVYARGEAPNGQTWIMGGVHGLLYLVSFVLLQVNVRKNGVVLPATFMKLGLLVPMVISVFLFGEIPTALQIVGFVLAVCAILLINLEKEKTVVQSVSGLVLLLLTGGAADAMSKIYEEWGDPGRSQAFLLVTFLVAFVLCAALMLYKKQRPGKAEIFYGLLIGIPNFFSAKFLLRALEDLSAVVVYPTYSVATILVVTLVGVAAFREKLGKRQLIGLAVILAALVLL